MNPVVLYQHAAVQFDRSVQAIGPGQWDLPTPCPGWSVRTIVNHVVTNYVMFAAAVGGTFWEREDARPDAADRLGDDPKAAWCAARDAMDAALTVPGALDGAAPFVYAPRHVLPLEFLLHLQGIDTTVHSWDLAVATGGDEKLDPELVAALCPALEATVPAMHDDSESYFTGLFGPPIPVATEADDQTRLLAVLGRRA